MISGGSCSSSKEWNQRESLCSRVLMTIPLVRVLSSMPAMLLGSKCEKTG
jgi:hypothetical protein